MPYSCELVWRSVTPSYDDGDQGFLNAYFKDLKYGVLFNWSNNTRQRQPKRLPAGLNANVGWYYSSNSGWKFEESELWIIHYTLGPTKPWVWWTHRLFDLNWEWASIRKRLPSHGNNPGIACQPLFWAPYPLGLLVYAALRFLCQSSKIPKLKYFATFNRRFSHFVPLPVLCLSYYLAFVCVVPTTMLPGQAEYVFWLWSSLFLLLFMGTYCSLCHVASKLQGVPSQNISRKLLQTFSLFAVFTISHVLQTLVPLTAAKFSIRLKTFLYWSALHLVVCQATGWIVILVWSRPCTSNHNRDKKVISI